jgi:dephospho-CoA kinase
LTIRIGLTGGIGCGKSAVGEELAELGAEYLDADRIVHELLATASPAVRQVAERFGEGVLDERGGIDRRRLGEIVFNDPAALSDLEAILHPLVRAEIRSRVARSQAPAIVLDAIKLIESGLYQEVDSVWVVTCSAAEQMRRLIERRGMRPEEAEARIGAQPVQESRLPYAQVVIDNNGSPEATREQVKRAWRRVVVAKISP